MKMWFKSSFRKCYTCSCFLFACCCDMICEAVSIGNTSFPLSSKHDSGVIVVLNSLYEWKKAPCDLPLSLIRSCFPAPLLRSPRAASLTLRRAATIGTGEPKWHLPLPTLHPPCLAFSRGASPISVQPILMHVFRNKLASLLKSLLWPMNIWCGQSCGVEGYNDGALSFWARQRGSDSGPTQNTLVLSGDRRGASSRRSRHAEKHFSHLSAPLKR